MSVPESFGPLARARLVAVIRADNPRHAVKVCGALLAAGVPAVELTFTTPGAEEALAEVRAEHGTQVLVGAGTIREPAQIDGAVRAGADFLVSPHLQLDLLTAMLATGLPCLPGVFTPSEVAQALDAGADVVKLFPASTGGPAHLKALRGPFPGLPAVVTGGVGVDDFDAWFAAGALAIGVGSEIAPRDLVQAERWDDIAAIAARFVAAARDPSASAVPAGGG